MQILCPECKTKLSLGTPKPGKFRPKCKHCGKPFVLQISSDVPAKVRLGRIKPTPKSDKTKVQRTAAAVDETIAQTAHPSTGQSANDRPSSVVSSGQQSASSVRSGVAKPPAANSDNNRDDDQLSAIPERLGGYKVLRMLGRGAMGAVYEAKQMSLDRIVALKTVRSRLANNPASLARFTREAYAAAQLTHHNVVQIYDFGEDNGRHYFSMEWVRGGPLSDVVRDKGAMDPKLAAGYTLQAARGLQFAHQNGMVHRDVKPANLLLSNDGVIKVADLGLVKIPDQMDPESDVGGVSASGMQSGTQVTMMGTAVGTPAYMAPEQGIDAASVDHRADIYSLGCSLFYMLVGRPPFEGSVVSEVMQQHAQQPLPDLANVNHRIPPQLNQIVQHAMAKRPSDRYATLAEMIRDLETYLGVSQDGSFSPTREQADQWESIGRDFAKATPLSRLTSPVLMIFASVCGLLACVIPFLSIGWVLFAPTVFLVGILTTMILAGSSSVVGTSMRRWIGSLSWYDLAVAGFGFLVAVFLAIALGLWLACVVGSVLGVILGVAYHFLVVVPTANAAKETISQAERFVRDLRIDGADEEGLRSFAARYAGKSWQSLYESLFGYESLCQIRQQLRSDPSFHSASTRGSIRDKVSATFLAKAEANRQSRDQKRIAQIEERGLASQGVSADEARQQAWQMAEAIVANARDHSNRSDDVAVAAQIKRDRQKEMLADARSGKYKRERPRFSIIKFAIGGQTRLLAGSLLLAIFAIWAHSTGLFDTVRAGDVSVDTITADASGEVMGTSTSHWSIGIAGFLLCLSAFVSGWRMTPFAVVATVVILFGPNIGVPSVGQLQAWMVSAAVGIAIYLPGIVLGESKND